MSNDKLAEQLAKLKETLAKWEKELIVYSKWAIENDGILSEIENKEILCIKSEIQDIKEQIIKIEKAKGIDYSNSGKTFTADTKKAWSFTEFQQESDQVVVDKNSLTAGQIAYFQTYEKVAQTYINRMAQIYEGKNNYAISEKKEPIHKLPIPLTGKMLADAALKTFVKYGNDISKVVPVELMLAQCQGESHFGTVIPRKGSKNSPFNVGVYDTKDAAFLDQVDNIEEGIEMYYDLMAEDYLSAKSADELDDNFVNERGLRYASSVNYEQMMNSIEESVKTFVAKNGLTMPNAEILANNNPAPVENNNTNTDTNQSQSSTGSIAASVGLGGVNNSADVKIVQKLLNEKINAGLKIDGDCGNNTKTAIKAFQQKTFGWEDGLVEAGGKTWKALIAEANSAAETNATNETSSNTETTGTNTTETTNTSSVIPNGQLTAQVGAGKANKPSDVASIQSLLNKNGYSFTVDGIFTAELGAAIEKFQKEEVGLSKPDGVVDPGGKTWDALNGVKPGAPPKGPLNKPNWIKIAEGEIGQKEKAGSAHNPKIVEYHSTTGGFKDDETAWCSSFVNWVMQKAGQGGTKSAAAVSWARWGKKVDKPAYGAVAVIDWDGPGPDWKGHVGFVVGVKGSSVLLLGGNQSNSVNVASFSTGKIIAYVYPSNFEIPANFYTFGEAEGDFGSETDISNTR